MIDTPIREQSALELLETHAKALEEEVERVQSDFMRVVIANAEVAKLNAEQAETIERLRADLKKLDPDPVVCGCREALCPHTPIAQLPRQELVKHYRERIRYLTGCVRDLTAALEKRDGPQLCTRRGGAAAGSRRQR